MAHLWLMWIASFDIWSSISFFLQKIGSYYFWVIQIADNLMSDALIALHFHTILSGCAQKRDVFHSDVLLILIFCLNFFVLTLKFLKNIICEQESLPPKIITLETKLWAFAKIDLSPIQSEHPKVKFTGTLDMSQGWAWQFKYCATLFLTQFKNVIRHIHITCHIHMWHLVTV